MKYFYYLSDAEKESIFFSKPLPFHRDSEREILAHALGAALYMPATRKEIANDILINKHEGLTSVVICLEDAIGDNQVEEAERMLLQQIRQISLQLKDGVLALEKLPLIFIRVRDADQMARMIEHLEEHISPVAGFVFPKFSSQSGHQYFQLLEKYNQCLKHRLYGMPILETEAIAYKETRMQELLAIKGILDPYRELVLNVRIGATDLSGWFGIRRSPYTTVYDIASVRDCIGDIVNVFTRIGSDYVVSGPVWEYFSNGSKGLVPRQGGNPYESPMDVFIREVCLDKDNGLLGKTIIHPSHIKAVQAVYVVSHEEYMDAYNILHHNNGNHGVLKSAYQNKMNEIRPHLNWAKKIMIRSKIFGVYHEHQNFTRLLKEQVYV